MIPTGLLALWVPSGVHVQHLEKSKGSVKGLDLPPADGSLLGVFCLTQRAMNVRDPGSRLNSESPKTAFFATTPERDARAVKTNGAMCCAANIRLAEVTVAQCSNSKGNGRIMGNIWEQSNRSFYGREAINL